LADLQWTVCHISGHPSAAGRVQDSESSPVKKVKKVKERILLREIDLRTLGTPLVNGITQCYLPPDRGDRPAFTPTGQVDTLSTP